MNDTQLKEQKRRLITVAFDEHRELIRKQYKEELLAKLPKERATVSFKDWPGDEDEYVYTKGFDLGIKIARSIITGEPSND